MSSFDDEFASLLASRQQGREQGAQRAAEAASLMAQTDPFCAWFTERAHALGQQPQKLPYMQMGGAYYGETDLSGWIVFYTTSGEWALDEYFFIAVSGALYKCTAGRNGILMARGKHPDGSEVESHRTGLHRELREAMMMWLAKASDG